MFKAMIVDDEKLCRESLAVMLKNYCPQINIVAMADCLETAVNAIIQSQPEIVFLDIELPDGKGFDLFRHPFSKNLKIIFTTAHKIYAPSMYGYYPVSFLLKPLNQTTICNAVARAAELIERERMFEQLKPAGPISGSISIRQLNKISVIELSDIVYCRASGAYTFIHLKDGKSICASKSLSDFELKLTEPEFMRVHKSFLVNLKHIITIECISCKIVMSNGDSIEFSHRKRKELMEIINKIAV